MITNLQEDRLVGEWSLDAGTGGAFVTITEIVAQS
jgi:hypothetical protein